MALNKEDKDNKTRKFILVTNTEQQIDKICYTRLQKAIKQENFEETVNYYNIAKINVGLQKAPGLDSNLSTFFGDLNSCYSCLYSKTNYKYQPNHINSSNWCYALFRLLTSSNVRDQDVSQ